MTAEDLIEILEERPFKILKLHLSDGRSYEIRHPEMVIVLPDTVVVGLTKKQGTKMAERITHCAIDHIVEVEPLEPARKK